MKRYAVTIILDTNKEPDHLANYFNKSWINATLFPFSGPVLSVEIVEMPKP